MEDKNASNEKSVSPEVDPRSAKEWELATYLANQTPKLLRTLDEKFWNDSRLSVGVAGLAPGANMKTIQKGPTGVKWGTAFTDGEGSHDTTGRKWIVAFDTAAKKAYAEAGPIGPIDWNVVEVKLGLSTSDNVEYVDDILKGKAIAEIEPDGHVAHGRFS